MTAEAWSWAALGLYVTSLVAAFGVRVWLHRRATGSAGFRGITGPAGSTAWWGGVLFPVAVVLDLVGLGAAALGLPVLWSTSPALATAGLAVASAGLVGTVWAQGSMGSSWRIGVDASERTALVTDGPFRWARNPVFTGMAMVTIGVALTAPSVATVGAVAVLVMAIELQVRVVEEPYLARLHGDDYRAYAMRVGRFVPYIGRARPQPVSDDTRMDV